MKKLLALMLALVMAFGCASAFAATQWGPTEPKSWLEDTSDVTLTVYVNMNWWTADWSDPVGQHIKELTGIDCKVVTPVADDDTQLIMMLNNGEVPDIIITELYKNDLLQMMIDSGSVAALDELAEEYAPEMFTNCDPDVWENYKKDDGHTYWLTGFGISPYYMEKALEYNRLVQANQRVLLIREDYYQEIGSPDISTPELFYEALVKMHENHPDKIAYYEGDSNVSTANNADVGMLSVYFGVPPFVENEDGSLEMNYKSQEWLDAVTYANKLARAGLYTTDSFIDDDATQQQKKFNGDVICYSWTAIEHELAIEDSRYICVEPWDSYRDYRTSTGWTVALIGATSEHKDRAIRFMSFMNAYEGILAYCGFEDTEGTGYSGDPMVGPHYYIDENGKPCEYPEYIQAMTEDGSLQAHCGATMYWWFGNTVSNNLYMWDASDEKYIYLNEQYGPKVVNRADFANSVIAPDSDSDAATVLSKYRSIYNSHLIDIVFAEDDAAFDAAVKAFYAAMDEIGISTLEEAYTEKHRAAGY